MKFLKTPFFTLVRNLFVAYLAFFLCHIAFILANRTAMAGSFQESGQIWLMIAGAFKFDTAGLMYLTLPYTLLSLLPLHLKEKPGYYRFLQILFITVTSAGVLANIADTIYFPYTGCRSTFDVFTEFQGEGTDELFTIFIDNIIASWPLVVFTAIIIAMLCLLVRPASASNTANRTKYYLTSAATFAVAIFLSITGMRGGIGKSIRPIAMSNAYQYVSTTTQAAAILNTPFSAIRNIGHKTMKSPKYYSQEELERLYTPVFQPDSAAVFNKRNVVILILESFGSEYSGAQNEGLKGIHDCTPFLDSLMGHSTCFNYSMANGRKSIDAMPSVLSGIPMLGEHLVLTSTMMTKPVGSIALYLKEKGYLSAFFHGADNSSMGFQSFARSVGFDSYYGMTEFKEDPQYTDGDYFDGVWAIWDEEFLQFMAGKLGSFSQPFIASVFTASSHNPFNIPDKYRQLFTDEGNLPIYKTVRYTDMALRKFFERASMEPWFENTLFVLTADHTNVSEHPDYQSSYGQFRIPIIIYDPANPVGDRRDCLAQQTDILPTVLGYLGYDLPVVCFGQNLLATQNDDVWVADYQNGIYLFYKKDLMIKSDGNRILGVYEYKKDTRLEHDVKGRYPDIEQQMEAQLKAIVQQYIEHMTDKPLIVSTP